MTTRPTPLLDAIRRAGILRTLDHALAQSLRRLDPDTPDAVLAAAALASLAVARGHAGFDPAAPRVLVDHDSEIPWPDADAWRRELAAARWVAVPAAGADVSDASRPLVFEGAPGAPGLLYLRRYREYERRVASGLQRIAAQPGPGGVDLVTGGPGTGKTTTIARRLVEHVEQAREAHRAEPRIALAAPTGRAAERMAESVRTALRVLAVDGTDTGVIDALPTTGTTLHRLLGTIPDSPRFRHHADNPLPFDVVVVDEASMIDLPLMAKLVEAVPDGARLILIGDPDQLPSVEAGDVLTGILAAAAGDADAANALQPQPGPAGAAHGRDHAMIAPNPNFPARRTHLTHSWRQHEALQLAPLAAAVRAGDSATALSLLRGGTLSGVHFHEGSADPLQTHRDHLLAHWRALASAGNPAEALALASRLRLLTAVREGPQGARTLNARIEPLLAGPGAAANRHFHGRLLLITENSYRHRLFNGDIGICFRDTDGSVMAWFPGDTPDAPRAFHPAALPAHDSAFAMTVHKAQGSEFDEVWLLLPQHDSRVLSRELVYTGITRARRELHVAGSAEVVETALGRHASRWSGLGWRLGSPF